MIKLNNEALITPNRLRAHHWYQLDNSVNTRYFVFLFKIESNNFDYIWISGGDGRTGGAYEHDLDWFYHHTWREVLSFDENDPLCSCGFMVEPGEDQCWSCSG